MAGVSWGGPGSPGKGSSAGAGKAGYGGGGGGGQGYMGSSSARSNSAKARGNRTNRGNNPVGGYNLKNRGGGQQGTDWDAFIADLLAGAGGGGGGGGYGGGGGGGGIDISGMLAAARAKYDETNAKLGDLYGDLAKTYEVLPAQTKQRYDQALAANNAATERIVQGNRARNDLESAATAAAADRLGIGTPPAASNTSAAQPEAYREAEYANQQLQLQSQNWGGLMGTAREAQVGRDNANTQGARDAGVLAQEELRKQYEAYVANLQAQAASSGGGGGGGGYSGGGGGGGTGNKLLDKMNEAMLIYALGQKGIYANQWSYSAYKPKEQSIYEQLGLTPAQYNAAAGKYAANGTNAAAQSIQNGMSPAVAAALRKQFG